LDKIIEFINNSIDSFEKKSNKSYDNEEVKNNDLMELSNISINNSENNEEMIILEDNININYNKNNNLNELFEDLKFAEEIENKIIHSKNNNNVSISINDRKLNIGNSDRFKKPLKENVRYN
jgi:hypothetical protein